MPGLKSPFVLIKALVPPLLVPMLLHIPPIGVAEVSVNVGCKGHAEKSYPAKIGLIYT